MKLSLNLLLILQCLLSPVYLSAQVTVLTDDFEDLDLGLAPEWTGDLRDFTFHTEDDNTLLRLDTEPDPSRSQIVTSSHTTSGSWEFYFRQDFSASNFNRAFIFLMADRKDLNYLDGSEVNGYAIRTGDNQSPRKIRLVRFDNGNQTELIVSDTQLQENSGYRVRVERTTEGEWSLYIAGGTSEILQLEGDPVTDLQHIESSHMGLLVRYSSTNTRNFFFDDLVIRSSELFRVTRVRAVSSFEVEAAFSYPLDPQTIFPANFMVDPVGIPSDAEPSASLNRVILTYADPIPDGSYLLKTTGIKSRYGEDLTESGEVSFSVSNPFRVVAFEAVSGQIIDLQLNLAPDPVTSVPSSFNLNGLGNPVTVELLPENKLRLYFNQTFPPGPIILSVQALRSTGGWQIPDSTELTTFLFGDAEIGDLVVNEILYRRSTGDSPQFVELFNNSDQPVNLESWTLATDRGGMEIPPSTVIRESGYIVLTDNENFSMSDDRIRFLPGFRALKSTGDTVVLKNGEGIVIDSLAYSSDWGGDEPGRSLERIDPLSISVDPSNWGTNMSESGISPLLQNTQFSPDLKPPELIFAALRPDSNTILLRFDEYVSTDLSTEILVNGRPSGYRQTEDLPGNEVIVQLSESQPGKEMVAEVLNIRDFRENEASRLQIPVARPVGKGDLVFNEIMFDPLDDDFDGLPNQSEYLELANARNHAVSLEGLFIHDRPDESGKVRGIYPVTSRSKWIPANGYSLLYPENAGKNFEESRTAIFFLLDRLLAAHSLQFDRTTLSLPMGGREIYLADSTGSIIDNIHYDPEWHNPNLIDTGGISLERISPHSDGRDPDNWGSSTLPHGGTPGRVNSLFQSPAAGASENSIAIEPNPFSPDGDGMDDRLFINYSLDDPDYMLRVRIYDRYGRLVRNLTHSRASGLEGSIIWNGRSDNGVTGRVGIYIVHVEAVNGATGRKKEFKKTAVLARRF